MADVGNSAEGDAGPAVETPALLVFDDKDVVVSTADDSAPVTNREDSSSSAEIWARRRRRGELLLQPENPWHPGFHDILEQMVALLNGPNGRSVTSEDARAAVLAVDVGLPEENVAEIVELFGANDGAEFEFDLIELNHLVRALIGGSSSPSRRRGSPSPRVEHALTKTWMQRGYPDGSLRTKSEVSQVNASLRDKARRKSGGTGITTGQGLTAYASMPVGRKHIDSNFAPLTRRHSESRLEQADWVDQYSRPVSPAEFRSEGQDRGRHSPPLPSSSGKTRQRPKSARPDLYYKVAHGNQGHLEQSSVESLPSRPASARVGRRLPRPGSARAPTGSMGSDSGGLYRSHSARTSPIRDRSNVSSRPHSASPTRSVTRQVPKRPLSAKASSGREASGGLGEFGPTLQPTPPPGSRPRSARPRSGKKKALPPRPSTAPVGRSRDSGNPEHTAIDTIMHKTAPDVLGMCSAVEGETLAGLIRVDQLTMVMQTHIARYPADVVKNYVISTSATHIIRTDEGARVNYVAWVKERGAVGRSVQTYQFRSQATAPVNDLRTTDDVLEALGRLGFEKMSNSEQRKFAHQLITYSKYPATTRRILKQLDLFSETEAVIEHNQNDGSNDSTLSLGVSVEVLQKLRENLKTKLNYRKITGYDLCRMIKLETRRAKVSFVDFARSEMNGNDRLGPANTYVVHSWKAPALGLLDALISYAEDRRREKYEADAAENGGKGTPQPYFWIDLLSVNQHSRPTTSSTSMLDFISSLIRSMRDTVVVLHPLNRPLLLSRKWCLFEMYTAVESDSKIAIIYSSSSKQEFENLLSKSPKLVAKNVCHVNYSTARTTRQVDNQALSQRVAQQPGTAIVESKCSDLMESWIMTMLSNCMDSINALSPQSKIESLLDVVDLHLDRDDYMKALPTIRDVLTNSWVTGKPVEAFSRAKQVATHLATCEDFKGAIELLTLSEVRLRPRESAPISKARLELHLLLEDIATRGGMLDDARRYAEEADQLRRFHRRKSRSESTFALLYNYVDKRTPEARKALEAETLHVGHAIIVTMTAGDETQLMDQLCAFSAALQLLCDLHTPGCFMVKRDNHRAFFFSNSPLGSLIVALATIQICKTISEAYPKYAVTPKIGIATDPSGTAFIFPNDYYGACLNLASKLGEDHAEAGQVFVNDIFWNSLSATEKEELNRVGVQVNEFVLKISKVTINGVQLFYDDADLEKFLHGRTLVPVVGRIKEIMLLHADNKFDRMMAEKFLLEDEAEIQNLDKMCVQSMVYKAVMFNSDMSGFTRITEKHGILHFLSMIIEMRRVVEPIIESNGGHVLHYDGDNVIARFPSPQSAVRGALEVQMALRKLNVERDNDSKVILKIGLAEGQVLDAEHQLFGTAWEKCFYLGEDLAEKRQVLIDGPMADHVDLSEFKAMVIRQSSAKYPIEDFPRGGSYIILDTPPELGAKGILPAQTTSARTSIRPSGQVSAESGQDAAWADEVLRCFDANNQEAQRKLHKNYERHGFAMVVKVHTSSSNMSSRLALSSCVLQMLESVELEGMNMVKRNEQRAIFFSSDSFSPVATALVLLEICSTLTSIRPDAPVSASIGMARGGDGSALIFDGDGYGDCFNVASKLGEDAAMNGEVLMDASMYLHFNPSDLQALKLAGITFISRSVDVSDVKISAFKVESAAADVKSFLAKRDITVPTLGQYTLVESSPRWQRASKFEQLAVERILDDGYDTTSHGTMAVDILDSAWHEGFTKSGTFFYADMSGFTRLTKKYGTVHFLGMIMKMRSIVRPIIVAVGGSVLHCHGDNLVAHFDDSQAAAKAALKTQATLREYNSEREADDRIILKVGVVDGDILYTGLQLFGKAWDLCERFGEHLAQRRQVLMTTTVFEMADLSPFEGIIESKTVNEYEGVKYHVVQVQKEVDWIDTEEHDYKAWETELLQAFESDKTDALASFTQKYETDGFAVIIQLHSDLLDERERLCAYSCVMQFMENVRLKGLRRVKRDEERAYFFTNDSYAAIVTALTIMEVCMATYRRHRRYRVEASVGIARGSNESTLMFGNDFFGDAVNIAARLCDETAKPGDIFIDELLYRELTQASIRMSEWTALGMVFEDHIVNVKQVEVHARELIYVNMDLSSFLKSADVIIPDVSQFHPHHVTPFGRAMLDRLKLSDHDKSTDDISRMQEIDERVSKKISESGVLMKADMSGFTRLTRKYGILHFLGMIMKMRSVVRQTLGSIGGKVLRFSGDFAVLRFDTAQVGVDAAMRVQKKLREYNQGRSIDHRIILKIALVEGVVFNTGQQFFGDTWDLCQSLSKELCQPRQVLIAKSVRAKADIAAYKVMIESERSIEFLGTHFVSVQMRKEKAWIGGSVGSSPIRPASVSDQRSESMPLIDELGNSVHWTDELLACFETGSKERLHELRKRYEADGFAIIVKMHTDMMDENDKLCSFSCILQQIAQLDLLGLEMIKRDEQRAFFFCADDFSAVATALVAVHVCAQLETIQPRYRVSVSVGVARGVDGKALVFPGDYYGDCVNVASKLGEDTAVPGEIMIDDRMMLHLNPSDKQSLELSGAVFSSKEIEISGVCLSAQVLDYKNMDLAGFLEDRDVKFPALEDVVAMELAQRSPFEETMLQRMQTQDTEEDNQNFDREWVKKFTVKGTFFNSDMSGFTRLTKKHGILHFLGMIVKMRSIVCPIISECGGRVLRFDGDNVIAQFPTQQGAVDGALKIQQSLYEYNGSTQGDSRIILKIGLADGEALDTGLQLFGSTWDMCEELGEELGEKRQVLMTSSIRATVDLSPFAAIVESETLGEHDGHQYCIVQGKKEPDWISKSDQSSRSTWESEVLRCFENDSVELTQTVRSKYEEDGFAIVFKLHSDLKDERDRLCVFSVIMQLIEGLPLEGLRLVKRDEQRAFFFCTNAFSSVAASLALMQLCLSLERKYQRYQVECSVGMARGSGKTLVFDGDFYGDSLNVASKLGEDTASPGQILIDELLYRDLAQSSIRLSEWIADGMIFEERVVEISKVEIHAQELILTNMDLHDFLTKLDVHLPDIAAFSPPVQNEFAKAMIRRLLISGSQGRDEVETVAQMDKDVGQKMTTHGTFFNSDMSGFTRLTKKFGILHFLGMIMKMRSIVRPLVQDAGGKILRYDGDNVIALFPTPQAGANAALRIQQILRQYNSNRHADHRILLKIGLADGEALDTGLQLFGHAWDLCEELGEELGEKRQVLMSQSVRSEVELSQFQSVIDSEKHAAHDGEKYTILQLKKETEWVFEAEQGDTADETTVLLEKIERQRLDTAATILQSAYRGHRVRRSSPFVKRKYLAQKKIKSQSTSEKPSAAAAATMPENFVQGQGIHAPSNSSIVVSGESDDHEHPTQTDSLSNPTGSSTASPSKGLDVSENPVDGAESRKPPDNETNSEHADLLRGRSIYQDSPMDEYESMIGARRLPAASKTATLSSHRESTATPPDTSRTAKSGVAEQAPTNETYFSEQDIAPDQILTEAGENYRTAVAHASFQHQVENGLPNIALEPPQVSGNSATAKTIF